MFLAVAGVTGCSTTPDTDLPPVPVGPPPASVRAERPSARIASPRAPVPPRPSGWDALDLERAVSVVRTGSSPSMVEDVFRLQVLLDRANFSPGCIDGRFGHQTRMALEAWQQREGLPATGEVDVATRARLPTAPETFTVHVVTQADHDGLAEVPRSWLARSRMPALPHETVQERLAEQYHLSQRALKELNPAASWPDPPVGTSLRVPRVEPFPKDTAARLEIQLAGKHLQVFGRDNRLLAHFPCSIARDQEKWPVGELHIANAAEHPNYTFDPALFADDPQAAGLARRLLIPPGPNSPVGVAWLSLDREGYGIHGTPHPEDIGKTESHGCFRLANWNARKLMDMVSIGTPVLVRQ